MNKEMIFQILSLLVLLAFYGIYFGKLLMQKKHGIRTHQIGTRNEKSIHTVEVLMSVAVKEALTDNVYKYCI